MTTPSALAEQYFNTLAAPQQTADVVRRFGSLPESRGTPEICRNNFSLDGWTEQLKTGA